MALRRSGQCTSRSYRLACAAGPDRSTSIATQASAVRAKAAFSPSISDGLRADAQKAVQALASVSA